MARPCKGLILHCKNAAGNKPVGGQAMAFTNGGGEVASRKAGTASI